MRWDRLGREDATAALFGTDVVTRQFDTPEFRGITFHEVRARSILNRVPGASRMPFEWTVNPYRGCSHACVYCFARRSHSYLDLDTGHDFDTQIVVKTNAPELLRRELAAPRWKGEHVAMGTNVDCYQRVEGRYRLMREILSALRAHGLTDDDIWDVGSIAAFFAMSNRLARLTTTMPNDEFYLMGRVPRS